MNLLCWNVRGLGKPRAVNRLKNKLRGVHPHILFLIETKLDKRRMEKVRRHCGFMFGIDVPALGTRGGLSIGWKNECDVSLRSYSQWHIDIEIKEESGIVWRFTGFYGRPEERNRAESWNLLKQLGRDQSLPWVVAGDFNEIAYSFEKMGGCVRSERQMFDFRDALQKCDLADLGFTGLWYTWEKGRLPSTNIRERLDRAVANTAWWELFPGYSITHLTHSISDHCPVLINTKGSSVSNCSIQKKPFRFESSWVLEDDLVERIKNHWETSDSQFPIRMTELGGILENWSLNKKKDRGERKKTLQRRLSDLMSADPDEESLAELLENATWKFEILERLFDDQQVKRISSIPLSADHRQDELIWKFDGTGEYNVKSGYRVLQQEDTSLTTGQNAQTHSNLSHCYAKIWDASLPTKIRIHGWKEANGAAHLMARLGRNLDSPSYWIEEAPAAVMDLVESEEHQLRSIS
ncbi:hypothetical protein HRI_004374500 [Hibiscus trionum]|uniref:Endonuclease/exonuclease/phosphatase domain-containing protein n=1 Tax=Hibiscus trionum TaxID=183268 RepID=A0A9W7J557_HIBTR|nr:hypothetical protein HRI_004374500 [Hibiscus trionum]